MKRRKRRRKPNTKPTIDFTKPFADQVQQLQSHIDRQKVVKSIKSTPNIIINEVIISRQQYKRIVYAWLYGPDKPDQKQRLMWLMLLYTNPNIGEVAKQLRIKKEQLLTVLEQLRKV